MTAGLEVLVQEVMAAMATAPSTSSQGPESSSTVARPPPSRPSRASAIAPWTADFAPSSGIRSWGRRGPAMHGRTSPMSSSRTSL